MTTTASAWTAETGSLRPSLTVFSETRMLSALGNDLRVLYDDVTDASQPDHLMQLAALIDAHRESSGIDV
ncbi:hypothetical protein G3T14_08715 [Methylobacterium sp. BTF04]|uniref:hypothetical protein n=1 Tax=Methylobacterium sp. BTF04 TaxID=2708300 RepID=UPI0013D5AEAB|nr:hypothetical protein [Methylobacterium sp. BTF04]NEU12213.1 hypothetical protein [Methylobacterium sp. BTF04]